MRKFFFFTALLTLNSFAHLAAIVIPDGLIYTCTSFDGLRKVHLLEVDPNFFDIKPAQSEGFQLEHVHSIASRNGAIAAVNGGFFNVWGEFADLPIGIIKIDGEWRTTPPKPFAAMGWSDPAQKILFDNISTKITGTLGDIDFNIDAINAAPNKNSITLYNKFFRTTTKTTWKSDLEFIAIAKNIVQIGKSNSAIPTNGVVVSVGRNQLKKFPVDAIKDSFTWAIDVLVHPEPSFTSSEEWSEVNNIMGAGPLLIRDGQCLTDFPSFSKMYTDYHKARTGVGILANGHWIFVVVEGKRDEYLQKSGGMSLIEFGELMLQVGCIQALNLDSGGSSLMVINNQIVSNPCGELKDKATGLKLRRVSDALLILPKGL